MARLPAINPENPMTVPTSYKSNVGPSTRTRPDGITAKRDDQRDTSTKSTTSKKSSRPDTPFFVEVFASPSHRLDHDAVGTSAVASSDLLGVPTPSEERRTRAEQARDTRRRVLVEEDARRAVELENIEKAKRDALTKELLEYNKTATIPPQERFDVPLRIPSYLLTTPLVHRGERIPGRELLKMLAKAQTDAFADADVSARVAFGYKPSGLQAYMHDSNSLSSSTPFIDHDMATDILFPPARVDPPTKRRVDMALGPRQSRRKPPGHAYAVMYARCRAEYQRAMAEIKTRQEAYRFYDDLPRQPPIQGSAKVGPAPQSVGLEQFLVAGGAVVATPGGALGTERTISAHSWTAMSKLSEGQRNGVGRSTGLALESNDNNGSDVEMLLAV